MELKTSPGDIRWWFWVVTLVFIVAALAGWAIGYFIVVAISVVQVLFFLQQEKSLSSFPVQIRMAYLAFTLFAFLPAIRPFIYALLLLGTVMVTFFGRCAIALMLKQMPWNHGREVRLN